MPPLGRVLSTLVSSVVGIAVMVVVSTVVFFVTVFVVTTGASMAGHDPSSDFVVLGASLIVVAVILTGGLTPRLSREPPSAYAGEDAEDPSYG